MSQTLIDLIVEIGWDKALFGLFHKRCLAEIASTLQRNSRKIRGHIWMSRLIRKLWGFQRSVWFHRNKWLHDKDQGLHSKEKEAINVAIRLEFTIGRNDLSSQYASLFTGRIDLILGKHPNSKLQWLDGAWEGQGKLRMKKVLCT